jgi:bacteriorhodopsin
MSSLLPESELRQDFARRRKRQWLIVLPVLIAILAMRAAGDSGQTTFYGLPTSVVIGIGFAMVIGAIVFSLVNWRCPSCSKYLGKGINPSFCAKCGFKLKA